MLTCPATRLDLTASDINSFEHRFAAGQASRRTRTANTRLRLRHGAGHLTKHGFVPAHANSGRKRAESYSSQATLCTEDGFARRTFHVDSAHSDNTSAGTAIPRTSSQPASVTEEALSLLELKTSRDHHLDHSRSSTANGVQQLLSRLQKPSTNIDSDPSFVGSQSWPPWTQATVSGEILPNLALDPGAPVFVPRIRFGSTNSVSIESGPIDGGSNVRPSIANRAQSIVDLRLRSSSEQNSAPLGHERLDSEIGIAISTTYPPGYQRRRLNDQNTAISDPANGFGRYLRARQPRNPSSSSGSQRQVIFPMRDSSRQHLIEFQHSRRQESIQDPLQSNSVPQESYLAVPVLCNQRSVSPAFSASSRSAPNLLRPPSASYFHVRSNSFSRRDGPEQLQALRSESTIHSITGGSSNRHIDDRAFEQHWLDRDSPLDELTQQLHQLTTRPQPVGRSFERPLGHRRPSLLTGNPFLLVPSPGSQPLLGLRGSSRKTSIEAPSSTPQLHRSSEADSTTLPALESHNPSSSGGNSLTSQNSATMSLARATPEISSVRAQRNSPILPSTPPIRIPVSVDLDRFGVEGHSSPMPQHPSATVTPSSLSLSAATTPANFSVYDDSKPPNTQPQTPADLIRTSKRTHGRSDTTSTCHAAIRTVGTTPSHNPIGRNPYRRTYPTAASTQQISEESMAIGRTTPATIRRARLERRSQSVENDIEANLHGLEYDRRTWMRRREDGTLDVTPPREGRFERYLS